MIHLAALKAVGESVQKPLEYYENNMGGALNLFRCMKEVLLKIFILKQIYTGQ